MSTDFEPRLVRVAVPVPLHGGFDYQDLADGPATRVGMRVLVRFGRRKLVGIVTATDVDSDIAPTRLRPIETVLDDAPVFDSPTSCGCCAGQAAITTIRWARRWRPPCRWRYAVPVGIRRRTATGAGRPSTTATPTATRPWPGRPGNGNCWRRSVPIASPSPTAACWRASAASPRRSTRSPGVA